MYVIIDIFIFIISITILRNNCSSIIGIGATPNLKCSVPISNDDD